MTPQASQPPHRPPSPADGVRAAERARASAMVARDTAALGLLLHPQLRYVHAPGRRDDRAGLLQFVAAGPAFLCVDLQIDDLACEGSWAWLSGTLQLTLRRSPDAEPVHARSWASALWWRDDAHGWRLRHFQSTRTEAAHG